MQTKKDSSIHRLIFSCTPNSAQFTQVTKLQSMESTEAYWCFTAALQRWSKTKRKNTTEASSSLTRKDVSQSPFLTFSPFLIFYCRCEYSILSQENSHGFHLKCFPKCQLKDTFFTLKLWSTPTQPIPYGFRSARYGDQVICSAAFIEPKCVFLLILLSSLLLWAWAGCDDMILMSVHQVCNQTHLPKSNLQYLSLCISRSDMSSEADI